MDTKQKILATLDAVTIADVSEDHLVDILLSEYKGQQRRIKELQSENESERRDLHLAQEQIREERHQLRSNPAYGAIGEYYFVGEGQQFQVVIEGGRVVQAKVIRAGVAFLLQQVSRPTFK